MRRSCFLVVLLLTLPAASAHAIAAISAGGTCGADGKVTFAWHYDEAGGAVDAPQWTGYDVYRRRADNCGDWVRVNADPYPRHPAPFDYTYLETPPDPNVVWQYQVTFVDAARQETSIGPCDCSRLSWLTCPNLTAPLTKGRLVDWGWTWAITPCLGSCLPYAYLAAPLPPALAPYVGTNQVIDFYGSLGCGSVEGCAIQVDHWQLASSCDITPVGRATWGRVKVLYR